MLSFTTRLRLKKHAFLNTEPDNLISCINYRVLVLFCQYI